jgi:glucan phosphoethanolaminetransferase (alkaline phosphatase superfamily)
MTEKELFFKLSLMPLVGFLLSSFILLTFIYVSSYSYSLFDSYFLFLFFVFVSMVSVFFFMLLWFFSIVKVKKYKGFPSIREAKIYYAEVEKLIRLKNDNQKRERIKIAKQTFESKMKALQEEKKKLS